MSKRSMLLQQFSVIPWVRRTPGSEKWAKVLRGRESIWRKNVPVVQQSENGAEKYVAKRAVTSTDEKGVLFVPHRTSTAVNPSLPETVRVSTDASTTAAYTKYTEKEAEHGDAQGSGVQGGDVQGGDVQAVAPFSLLYTELVPGVWLLAECDEWDQGSQAMFSQLVMASRKLTSAAVESETAAPAPALEWFHWPMRLPAVLDNHEENARHALRGWVKGRQKKGALWISLGRRFVVLMVPEPLPRGVRYTGRRGMDVIWFDSLPAMQMNPNAKRALWRFIQTVLMDR
ncbi:MAG: hypothetical protein P8144_01150 [Gammaproteobacteria bacterium]